MKLSLKDYKKMKNENKMSTTSVSITEEQKKFLDSQGLNVSKLFRDFIDVLILENKKSK